VMILTVASGIVTPMSFNGKVLAISNDGHYLVVFDNSINGTYFFDTTRNTIITTANGIATSSILTPDNQWSLSTVGQQLVRQGATAPTVATNCNYTPKTIGLLSQGSLAFITSSSAHSIDVRSTCDQSDLQTLAANNPTLIAGLPNGTGAVAVDVPQLDVIATPLPSGSCPVVVSNALNSYDLQAGNFTPRQLLVSFDSSHAWVISDLSSIISFDLTQLAPTAIPLVGNVPAFSGGMTLDSQQLYVGTADNTVHRISVASMSDAQQINPGLKDANSVAVAPDLVTVLPK